MHTACGKALKMGIPPVTRVQVLHCNCQPGFAGQDLSTSQPKGLADMDY